MEGGREGGRRVTEGGREGEGGEGREGGEGASQGGSERAREGGARTKLGFPPPPALPPSSLGPLPPSSLGPLPPALPRSLSPSLSRLVFPPSLQPSLTASYTFLNFIMYSMIMYSRPVKFSGITSPIRPPTLRNITSSNVER